MKAKKCKWLASLLAVVMTLSMLPCTAFAEETGKGHIEEITNAYVVIEDTYVVVVDSTVYWCDKDTSIDGPIEDGCWIGFKIIAPESVNDSSVKNVKYSNDETNTLDKSFGTNTDSDGKYYMGCWLPVTPEYLEDALAKGSNLQWTYQFDWNGNGDVDQTFTFNVDPKDITLMKDGSVWCQTENGKMTVKDGKEVHYHDLTAVDAKAATCTEDGNTACWNCAICGKYFSDKDGKAEIPEDKWVIKALGHSLTAVAAKAATCTEAGNIAYWYCAGCDKYFSDADGKTEIAKDSWVIKALGHDEGVRAAVAATCHTPGRTEETYCKRCNLVIAAAETIPATGKHSYVNGVCTACGVKNPMADVKSDSIKPVAGNDKAVADNNGLVIKSDSAITDEVLAEIKEAVDNGAVTITTEDTLHTTEEQKAADGGKNALLEAAKTAVGEAGQELTKLAEKLDAMRGDKTRKNAQIEKVVDVTVDLLNGASESVAQLIELPRRVTVTVPITDEMYTALKNKRVCVIRSHTDIDGNVTTSELSATLSGAKGSYVLTFQTDKASTFAVVSYEKKTSGGSGSGSSSGSSGSGYVETRPVSANTADDSQMVLWMGSAALAAAAVVVLARKKRIVK